MMLAAQPTSRWTDEPDDVDKNELQALLRAVRRAAARAGEPRRPPGRVGQDARIPPDLQPDRDLRDECLAADLAAMSDRLDAMLDGAAVAATIAEVEETIEVAD